MPSAAIRVIKPVVMPTDFIVGGLWGALFASVVAGFFTLVFSNLFLGLFGGPYGRMGSGLETRYAFGAFLIVFVVVLLSLAVEVFLGAGRTTYAVYPDRIEVESGVLSRTHQTFALDPSADVELTESIAQRARGAGTITVTDRLMPAGDGSSARRSITLANVPQPREVYELLRSLTVTGERD